MARTIRVLVFEDDDLLRKMLERVMQLNNYEVFCYENPTACPLSDKDTCSCSDGNICADIIISDIKMPNMDGLTFVQQQLDRGCCVPVDNICIISGFWTQDCIDQADKMGVFRIRKPFSIDYLVDWLKEREQNIDVNTKLIDPDLIKTV